MDQLMVTRELLNAATAAPAAISFSAATRRAGACGGSKSSACSAAYTVASGTAPMTLMVRAPGGGFFDFPDVYECEFTFTRTGNAAAAPAAMAAAKQLQEAEKAYSERKEEQQRS